MREMELLAPGGDVDSIKAAIAAGADAVYCGVHKFNARNRASNISLEELSGVLHLAHSHKCKVFLTLNILIVEQEIPDLLRLLNRLVNTGIDGLIIQDPGLFYLLNSYFRSLDTHASTQLTTHNKGQIKFLKKLGATRVNLSRELNINEINFLSSIAHDEGLLSEVFVHGSYCISFSGLCYMSSVQGGNSGNRGRCSQPCRDRYEKSPTGKHYPLNLKDNSAWSDLKKLSEAGVNSIKIEGRIKKFHYVYAVVDSYRKQLQRLYKGEKLNVDKTSLHKTFNRGFSRGFLQGAVSRHMYTDNPRDISSTSPEEFSEIKTKVKDRINKLSIDKIPLTITVSGRSGSPLRVAIATPDSSFEVSSEKNLRKHGSQSLNEKELLKRFRAVYESGYHIKKLDQDKLPSGLYIPFSELTQIKNRILYILNDSREAVAPVELPALKRPDPNSTPPSLSVLISSAKDMHLFEDASLRIYFQLPESPSHNLSELIEFFRHKPGLIPWFPTILMGREYQAAIKFLQELQPEQLVTNNSGIAYESGKMGIPWTAGPFLNLVNSYSLIALKEKFKCRGAFISNEISQRQIRGIRKPDKFDLYYSICHPIELMTSRQCLFQQTVGCEKEQMDDSCLQGCKKSTSIRNLKKETLFIEKEAGSFNRIYNETHCLNTEIVKDVPELFSGFLVDLRKVKTNTRMVDKRQIIQLFKDHLLGDPNAAVQLKQSIYPTNNKQYHTGI